MELMSRVQWGALFSTARSCFFIIREFKNCLKKEWEKKSIKFFLKTWNFSANQFCLVFYQKEGFSQSLFESHQSEIWRSQANFSPIKLANLFAKLTPLGLEKRPFLINPFQDFYKKYNDWFFRYSTIFLNIVITEIFQNLVSQI